VGRPRTGWADVVQREGLHLLGIKGWRKRAENGDEWRRLMRQTMARKRLQRHIWNGIGYLTFSRRNFFFILAHPVYKM